MSVKSVPCDLSAERATLGSILLDREAIVAVAGWLLPEFFYLEKHALVYSAMLTCYGRREPPDLTTVTTELRRQERLDLVGGMSFLGELLGDVPTAVHIEYYARSVERTAVLRRLIEAGGKIVALGYDESDTLEVTLDKAEATLFAVAQRRSSEEFVSLSQVAGEYFEDVEQADEDNGLPGLTTTIPDLDAITGGMKNDELIILAARPSVGKTALSLSIADGLARQGYAVGIFSLEMNRKLLLQRLLAMATGCSAGATKSLMRRGDGPSMDALGHISELPIFIDHTSAINVYSIRSRARRLALMRPIDFWIVDYLQLVDSTDPRADDVRRVTEISRGLMQMAREFGQPVLALSQLSRAVEGRASHVPQLSDLRGSGSIEQDASQVWALYREELYDAETTKKGLAELHVLKNRNGDIGVAPLNFERHTTRFLPLERARAI
ncbi:replicative DNA helicase [Chloroflexales bacterium ZM16-3]|nr:replicative DNA helicase [Chloroflexales bacterium ZM16-3]